MTGYKKWFVSLDDSMKTRVKFADDSFLCADGIGKVMFKKKDGKTSFIAKVMYVPKMTNNLLTIGQLHDKRYNFFF